MPEQMAEHGQPGSALGARQCDRARELFSVSLGDLCPLPSQAQDPLLCMGTVAAFGCWDQVDRPCLPQLSPELL